MTMNLSDRQTDRLTDRQTDRQDRHDRLTVSTRRELGTPSSRGRPCCRCRKRATRETFSRSSAGESMTRSDSVVRELKQSLNKKTFLLI